MNAGRLIAPALVGIVAAIFAGTSLGRALAPDGAAPAPAAVPRPAAPDPALRPVLSRLDGARLIGRSKLRRAHTPALQAAASGQLAAAHRRAAAQLGVPLNTRLAAATRAYEALATAAHNGSAARYQRARRAVVATDAALRRAVDAARTPPPARTPARASAPRPDGGSAPLPLVLLGFAATALIGLFVGTTTAPRQTV